MRRALPLAFVLLLAACAGSSARTYALWPVVQNTWPAVKADAQLGSAATPGAIASQVGLIDTAINNDDRHVLVGLDFSPVEQAARAGVQERVNRGEITAGVALSFSERITKFAEAMQELTKR